MLCQICQKNPATLHIEEIVGSTKTMLHLCSACAQTNQLDSHTENNSLKLAALAYQLASDKVKSLQSEAGPPSDIPHKVCSKCATTLAEYHNTGRLGCPACYDSFREHLAPILERMHRDTTHKGTAPPDVEQLTANSNGERHPDTNPKQCAKQNDEPEKPAHSNAAHQSVARIRNLLDQAVKAENYEQAAKLRDRLQTLASANTHSKP